MQYLANPARFLRIANAVLPYVWSIALVLLAVGLYGALVTAPPDYQQGETVRIMYVHVPAAWMALFVYAVMALASAVAIIFRHPLADVAAKAAAPIGAVFCSSHWSPARSGASPCGVPGGNGMHGSHRCSCCSFSISATWPSGRQSTSRTVPQ